jgi:hypothetical protein
MRIRFTNHAQIGMFERDISASRAIDTLRHTDTRFAERDGVFGCTKQFGAKTLKVIFRQRGKGECVIITAYYL